MSHVLLARPAQPWYLMMLFIPPVVLLLMWVKRLFLSSRFKVLLSLPNASDEEHQYFEDTTDPFSSSVRGLQVRQPIIIFINRLSAANELIGFGSVVGWLATISHCRLWTFCVSLSSSPLSVSTVSLIFQSYNSDSSSFVILYFPSSSSLFLDLLPASFFSLRRPVVQSRGWMLKVTLEHIITSERPKKKKSERI